MGRRRDGRPGRGRQAQGHHRAKSSRGSRRIGGRPPAGRSTASSTACRTTWDRGLLVQQGPVRPGRHHRAADHLDELNAAVAKLKAGEHHADRRGRQGQVARRVLLGLLRAARVLADDAEEAPRRTTTSTTRASSRPARTCRQFLATKPFQRRLPRHPGPAGREQLGRPGRQRQGRDGAAGPLGPRAHGRPHARQEGVGTKLGWFPFPAVAGGAGRPDAALGGGDGFSCAKKAPAGVRRVPQVHRQRRGAEGLAPRRRGGLPVDHGAPRPAVKDPMLQVHARRSATRRRRPALARHAYCPPASVTR